MAAERTWLAWWRSAMRTGGHAPLQFRTVGTFTVGGVALAVLTVVLVIAQT